MEELKDNGGGLLKWLLDILVGNNGHIHDTIYMFLCFLLIFLIFCFGACACSTFFSLDVFFLGFFLDFAVFSAPASSHWKKNKPIPAVTNTPLRFGDRSPWDILRVGGFFFAETNENTEKIDWSIAILVDSRSVF